MPTSEIPELLVFRVGSILAHYEVGVEFLDGEESFFSMKCFGKGFLLTIR